MEQPTNTKKKRKSKKKGPKKAFKILKVFITFILVVGLVTGIAAGGFVYNILKDTPRIYPNNLYSLLSENSFVLDVNGELVEKVERGGLRTNIAYSDIPDNLINAFVSIEDKTFWTHKGFNIVRIFGAVWSSLTSGDRIGGTSTLTQQLARNLYLPEEMEERSYTRKIKEAYYAVNLENYLSKEQIIEAYMNTVYLGFSAYGVQAASYAYFSKDIDELSIAESAVIAGIMKSPARYSPIKRLENIDADPTNPNVIDVGQVYTILYDDRFRPRQELVLKLMHEYEYISEDEYNEALAEDIRVAINPSSTTNNEISSYFVDMVKKDASEALMDYYDINKSEANDMLYNAGLRIYSTLDLRMQKIVEEEFDNSENFPNPSIKEKDAFGNILDKTDRILLYKYENLISDEDEFIIRSYDYDEDENGNITLLKNRKLQFDSKYEDDKLIDIQIHIKDMFIYEDSSLAIINDGIINIPSLYKSYDDNNNLVISSDYFIKDTEFKNEEDGHFYVNKKYFSLSDKVLQPQSSMVIIDYETGQIKALVGGRNIEGKMLYNRALMPNQPGSSIKPLAVYTPALDNGYTAASIIDDAPMVNNAGAIWPNNWYSGFKGLSTLRYAVEYSINVVAVKVLNELSPALSISYLKDFGITTVQETGAYNDVNAAALALGGMTHGVSPLEMAAAYGTIANRGTYVEPIAFLRIEDKYGNVIVDNTPDMRKVLDSDVAYMMTNILESTVTNGLGWRANISAGNAVIPVAGKTGTTNNNYDAWFIGFTPYYVGSIWIGNDLDFELSQGSSMSAQLYSKVMKKVHEDYEPKSFYKPENIISVQVDTISGKLPSNLSSMDPRGTVKYEQFIEGTEPTTIDNYHVVGTIESTNGYLYKPYCPSENVETRVFVRRPYSRSNFIVKGFLRSVDTRNTPDEYLPSYYHSPDDMIYELPIYYCPAHNPNISAYPIAPLAVVETETTGDAIEVVEPTEAPTEAPTETQIEITETPDGTTIIKPVPVTN